MMRFFIVALFVMPFVACSTTSVHVPLNTVANANIQAFRNIPPPLSAQPPLRAPVPIKQVLDNGLVVLVVPRDNLPILTASLVVRSGSAQDPADMPGVAGFLAEVLKMGTTKLSAKDLADEIETLGTKLDIHTTEDSTTLSMTAMQENFDHVFDILADVVQHPRLTKKEINRVRYMRQAELMRMQDNPRSAAGDLFLKLTYGSQYPYGHTTIGTHAALKNINDGHLKHYYKSYFQPTNAALIIVGNITAAKAFDMGKQYFGHWHGSSTTSKPATPTKDAPAVIALVNKPGAPQSQLAIGHVGVARDSADYFPLVICNTILGGMFNSRINMNLREAKGYTYGAYSAFHFLRAPGPFIITTGVRTDVTDLSIIEILKEIETIRNTNVGAEELTNVKNFRTLSLPSLFETIDDIAGMINTIYIYDLPLDYYQTLPENIQRVQASDVRRVAQQYLHPDKLVMVVVGDKEKVQSGLNKLQRGKVVLFDKEGNSAF